MKPLSFISVLSIILSLSCNQPIKNDQNTESVNSSPHHSKNTADSIELNNGKKWKVDNEMIVHIRTMELDIHNFDSSGNKNYLLLAKRLQLNIDLLTANCTMKGKAHDELHKWLLPFIDLVNEFEKEKDTAKSAELFNEIQAAMNTFNLYFQ